MTTNQGRQAWHLKTESEALAELGARPWEGLTPEEAARRRASSGANVLETAGKKGAWRILLGQFTDVLILVLLAAALIALFLGEPQDSVAILAVVLLNAALGFAQEYRAGKAIEALQRLAAPQVKVKRRGITEVIPARELVPGDIVILEAGSLVPADLRLLEAATLQINESTLTGESLPVEKASRPIRAERVPVADQRNMAFNGTIVSAGRGLGVVVRTGMSTELGKIARLLKEEVEVETPLQRRIARFGKNIAILVVGLCAIIFLAGLERGEAPMLMFLTALSLAVAAIPEALPTVVTVALALGVRVMSRRNALVRKLSAVEALGSVTVICSDKTGTLTENRMTVRELRAAGPEAEKRLFQALALSNDATVDASGALRGDPTETALLAAALAAGYVKADLAKEWPRVAELPFSADRGMMSTVHRHGDGRLVFVKGAPERIFERCRNALVTGGIGPFDTAEATAAVSDMASQGYRVLAFAFAELGNDARLLEASEIEQRLTFIGLVGLIDPPRKEAANAISLCLSAGIRPVMITGDHPETARAIARKIGILDDRREGILTGRQLSETTDRDLVNLAREIAVYARAAPEQKVRIVQALQAGGEVVAMTGDGVNDAPALKRADIGIAMGKGGTDVAREASRLILLDDDFATIVAAVREGRRIYDNIQKFIKFSLSGNSGVLFALFLAPLIGLPMPLLPIQILWVNLVTDGLPGLALAFEPEERGIMSRPPRDPQESVFTRSLWQHCLWVGLLTGGVMLGTLAYAFGSGNPRWQSMAFTVLALGKMGHVLAIRSERESLLAIGLLSNRPVLGAVLLTIGLQLTCLYIPGFNSVLGTASLTRAELASCVAVASIVFIAVEGEKWIRRRKRKFF